MTLTARYEIAVTSEQIDGRIAVATVIQELPEGISAEMALAEFARYLSGHLETDQPETEE